MTDRAAATSPTRPATAISSSSGSTSSGAWPWMRPGPPTPATPGTAMALAPLAHVLFTRVMHHDPSDPDWPDRDRFVLSNGHASILLYSMLYLTGYGLTLDDLRAFRQWGSRTPGHPEHQPHPRRRGHHRARSGQGVANGVGMGIAERWLRTHFSPEVCDHHTFVIAGDGCFEEGISHEAASLAGHLELGPPGLRLRRQPHHHRRAHRALLLRQRGRALRRLRLVGRQHRRGGQRPRRPRGGAAAGQGRRGPALADHPPQPHRLSLAPPDGHGQGPRRPVPAPRRSA